MTRSRWRGGASIKFRAKSDSQRNPFSNFKVSFCLPRIAFSLCKTGWLRPAEVEPRAQISKMSCLRVISSGSVPFQKTKKGAFSDAHLMKDLFKDGEEKGKKSHSIRLGGVRIERKMFSSSSSHPAFSATHAGDALSPADRWEEMVSLARARGALVANPNFSPHSDRNGNEESTHTLSVRKGGEPTLAGRGSQRNCQENMREGKEK